MKKILFWINSGTMSIFGLSKYLQDEIDGEFYALLNSCCHQRGPVCTGDIRKRVGGDVPPLGKLPEEYFTEDYVVICPWHGWAYDIKTGEHAGDPDIRIPTYKIVVEEQTVYLDV